MAETGKSGSPYAGLGLADDLAELRGLTPSKRPPVDRAKVADAGKELGFVSRQSGAAEPAPEAAAPAAAAPAPAEQRPDQVEERSVTAEAPARRRGPARRLPAPASEWATRAKKGQPSGRTQNFMCGLRSSDYDLISAFKYDLRFDTKAEVIELALQALVEKLGAPKGRPKA